MIQQGKKVLRMLSGITGAILITGLCILPCSTASAEDATTIEINGGLAITLNPGEEITSSASTGVPIELKNVPPLGAPDNGLAVIQVLVTWDPSVLSVTSRSFSTEASAYFDIMEFGEINEESGYFQMALLRIEDYQDISGIVLCYMGLQATGSADSSSVFNIDIIQFMDGQIPNQNIPVTTKGAAFRVSGDNKYIVIDPPNGKIREGESLQYTAEMHAADGSIQDITPLGDWSVSDELLASIQSQSESTPGLATGLSVGIVTVSITYDGLFGSAVLTVFPDQSSSGSDTSGSTTTATETTPPDETTQTDTTTEPDTAVDTPATTNTTVPDTATDQPATTDEPATTETTTETTTTQDDTSTGTVPTNDADDSGSGLPIPWIVGGAVVFIGVLGTLGYTLFIRGR